MLEPPFRLCRNGGSISLFDAFSSREPVSTPHQVRGRLSLENALQRAEVVRHGAELPVQFGIAEVADDGIAGTAEGDRTDAAGGSRQDLGTAQRRRRTLTFLGRARDRR